MASILCFFRKSIKIPNCVSSIRTSRIHSQIQLEEYIAEYKHSSWTPLLKACIAYSRRQYDEAASYLESTPKDISVYMAATYHFFRGVNLLKTFSERTIAGQVSTLSVALLPNSEKRTRYSLDSRDILRILHAQPSDFFRHNKRIRQEFR